MSKVRLSRRQKEAMYRDGFLILRKAVPTEMVTTARQLLNTHLGAVTQSARRSKPAVVREVAETAAAAALDPRLLDLFNKTDLSPTVDAFLGEPANPVKAAQIATRFPEDAPMRVNESGYREKDTPFHGWFGHLDGLWNGGTQVPDIGEELTPHKRRLWYRNAGTNTIPRTFPELNCNVANFTALIGVALSDQRREGAGNLGLLKGAHRRLERFFREQREAGGPLGPDGPGWPREHEEAPNGHGLRHFPDAVRESYRRTAVFTEDGHCWPRPTLMKLAPGDAVIVHFSTPHGATLVSGPDPRFMLYFRVTPKSRPQRNHRVYPDALCDIWLEWKSMHTFRK